MGANTLTYTVTQNGCTNSATKTVTVNAVPTVNAGSNETVCSGESAFTLSGFTPTGGSWSGSGVNTSGVFTPSAALVGTQTLTYSVTQNGCTGTATKTVTVNATPSVSAGSNRTTCANGTPFNLTGSPAGGSWSGTGVSTTGTFTPSVSIIGTQTLTYTASQNGCTASATMTVQVTAEPVVSAGPNVSVCSQATPIVFDDFTPTGGSWSGTGVSPSGTFTPTAAMAGYTITLTYTVSQNGCVGSATRQVTVNASPSVNINPVNPVCADAIPFNLVATPAGGTWSGPGVNASGIFTPAPNLIGTRNLTYTVTQNGCTGTGTISVQVRAVPNISFNSANPTSLCAGGSAVTFAATPTGGTWSGTGISTSGTFTPGSSMSGDQTLTYSVTQNGCSASATTQVTVIETIMVNAGPSETLCNNSGTTTFAGTPAGGTWSGTGISAAGLFNPATGSPGNRTLTYTVTQNGCSNSATKTVTVNAAPTVSVGTGLNVCQSAAIITLSGGTPAGGTWSGTGVENQNRFNPATAGPGTFALTYSVTQNGCTGTATMNAIVRATPNIVFGSNNASSLCTNSPAVTLTATPTGGTWSGTGINSSGVFTPTSSMSGAQNIQYSVTQNNCSATANTIIQVNQTLVVNAGPATNVCTNAGNQTLVGTPAGGTWSGQGVTGAGVFNPTSGSPGVRTLTYSVTAGGCTGSDTRQITVVAAPTASVGSGFTVCANAGTQNLSGATPAGGTWIGNGVTQSSFNPATAGVGSHPISYRVIQNGCTATATMTVTVNAVPTPNAGNRSHFLASGQSVNLTGATPTGGTWSGQNVTANGAFTAAAALAGDSVLLSYSVTQNGCTGTATRLVNVHRVPTMTVPSDTICRGDALGISHAPFTGTQIRWMRNNSIISGATSQTYIPFTAGRYKVEFRLNGTTAMTAESNIAINEIPTKPEIAITGNTLVSNSEYPTQWFLDGTAIPGAIGASYNATQSGIYTCQAFNGTCQSPMSNPINFVVTSTRALTFGLGDWRMYPNPANEHLEIEWINTPTKPFHISLTDLTGKVVYQTNQHASAERKVQLNTGNLPAGVYVLTWKSEEGKGRKQFAVAH
jgi:hypothetical protein